LYNIFLECTRANSQIQKKDLKDEGHPPHQRRRFSGGAKTHVLSLLQHLNETITAQLVCFRDGPFADEARALGIPTEIMSGNDVARTRRQLAQFIRAGGYQIIHCHGARANMIGSLLRGPTGLPVVSTVHSRLQAGLHGPASEPAHLSAISTPGRCGSWTSASACPTPWWTC
jgi:hypothetical protein